jgi:hypothetical protein
LFGVKHSVKLTVPIGSLLLLATILVASQAPAKSAFISLQDAQPSLAAYQDALPEDLRSAAPLDDAKWAKWISNRKIVSPERAVDGINLIWFSDFVVSGGGTMNREAAALRVPVYSIFRGKIGAVDRHLQQDGRLILIESVEDIRKRIVLKRRQKTETVICDDSPTLRAIVDGIRDIARSHPIQSSRQIVRPQPNW